MPEVRAITLPISADDLASLRMGEALELTGPIFTMRDVGHQRALAELQEEGELPFGLSGQALYYAGPTPARGGRPIGSVGPTTSGRMDFAAPALYRAGIPLTIGKSARSSEVVDAIREVGGAYLVATGGAAALLASHVVAATPVAWDDLGTEALVRLDVERFPVFVAIDPQGNDLFAEEGSAT